MEKEILENYKKSCQVSEEVAQFAKTLIKESVKILDVAEKIEKKIKELGAKVAFPTNISINENAAHYTPDISDPTILKESDLVKVDIGVHLNG